MIDAVDNTAVGAKLHAADGIGQACAFAKNARPFRAGRLGRAYTALVLSCGAIVGLTDAVSDNDDALVISAVAGVIRPQIAGDERQLLVVGGVNGG